MTHKVPSLRARLHQAGIAVNENDTQASPPIPWFVRVLQAFSGWLAAIFLLGFIAMVAASVVESTLGSLSLGAMMLLAAFGLFRVTRSDVGEHLALAVSLAGQLLVAWGLVNVWETSAYLWWVLLGLQGVLALVMPSHTHRGFSAFAASVALYMALAMSAMGSVASGVVLLALTALWLNEFRWPTRIPHVQAWGYGLLVGLLVIQGMAHTGGSLLYFDAQATGIWAALTPWLGVALVALAPVDPRSLMQGDYMALNFALSNEIRRALQSRRDDGAPRSRDGYAIVRLDEQRVAQFQRLAEGESTLDHDERRLHYRLRNGQVRLATDAFFFQEGHAERYEPARYGRFRINEDGEPLLVSLHDSELDLLGASVR